MKAPRLLLLKATISVALFWVCLSLFGQEEAQTPPEPPEEKPLQTLVLSIQYGKGGSIQEFRLKNGEAAFVQTGNPLSLTSQQPNPQETKEEEIYRQQLGQISQKIADKINAVQKKQKELDSEIYPAYQAPLDVERKSLEHDLKLLEDQRDQLQSQKTAADAHKPAAPPPPPPPKIASGITVSPVISGNGAVITLQPQGKDAAAITIKTPINTWVQIFSAEKGQGLDIWAKVTPMGE